MPTNHETSKPNGFAIDASGLLSGIQQKVTSRVDAQKNRAADGLGGIADVIRSASDELRLENETLASYVDMASDQMRRVANQIRERGVADMMDDVNAFAQRRPTLFVGVAFVLGIGLARFLKSSARYTEA
jgi:ClpP class serine protease